MARVGAGKLGKCGVRSEMKERSAAWNASQKSK